MAMPDREQVHQDAEGQSPTQKWAQPSHPSVLKVQFCKALASGSDSKAPSFSLTALASSDFPPNMLLTTNTSTTLATAKDYSTVQISRMEHIRLNSDLLYCNHSCDPNIRFVTSTLDPAKTGPEAPIAGTIEVWSIKDIRAGDELRFFYPSTEWEMAQPFRCSCGAEKCLGLVDGAQNVSTEILKRYWLSEHIESLLAERDGLN